MSERVAKVESLIQQVVAAGLLEYLDRSVAALATITRVDASPDLRQAIVWIGVLADDRRDETFKAVLAAKADLQRALARRATTKFVPHLTFKLDTGGQYAAEIDRLLKQI